MKFKFIESSDDVILLDYPKGKLKTISSAIVNYDLSCGNKLTIGPEANYFTERDLQELIEFLQLIIIKEYR
jgi:hypothetical protein